MAVLTTFIARASSLRYAWCLGWHVGLENHACRWRRVSSGASRKPIDRLPDSHLRRSCEDDPSCCFNDRSKSFAASHSSSNADRNLASEKLAIAELVPSLSTEPAGIPSDRLCFSQNRSCSGLSSRQSSRCSGLMRLIVTRQRTLRFSHKMIVTPRPFAPSAPPGIAAANAVKSAQMGVA